MKCMATISVMTLANIGGAQAAITPSSVDGVKHFVDCLGALFNNPPEHAANCAPGIEGPSTTITSPGGAPVVVFCEFGMDQELIRLFPGQTVLVAQVQQEGCLQQPT
jgi:hypothetical protein